MDAIQLPMLLRQGGASGAQKSGFTILSNGEAIVMLLMLLYYITDATDVDALLMLLMLLLLRLAEALGAQINMFSG